MGLFDAFSSSKGESNARMGYQLQAQALKKGKKEGIGYLSAADAQATPYLTDAQANYKNLQGQQQAGYDMYQNSLGLNGQAGYDAAQGAFHQGPGYQFALDQANQNVLRNQASLGALNGGNTLMALSDRAQQLQNLEFGNWQDRLKGFDPMRGAEGYGSLAQNLAQLKYNIGVGKSGVATDMQSKLADAGYNLYGNINNAQNTANSNLWGAILGAGKIGASIYGA